MKTDMDQQPGGARETESGKTSRRLSGTAMAYVGGLAVLVVVVSAVVWAMNSRGPAGADSGAVDPDQVADQFPASGSYSVAAVDSKLCLGEGPSQSDHSKNVVVQQDCQARTTGLTFIQEKNDAYGVTVNNADQTAKRCLAVEEPAVGSGDRFAADKCESDRRQRFELVPLGADKFRIRLADTTLCMGVEDSSTASGAPVDTAHCAEGEPSQEFKFDLIGELAAAPTDFKASWSDTEQQGTATWGPPESDGGFPVSGYVVRDCEGNDLAITDAKTFDTVSVSEPIGGCVTVRAVTEVGEGLTATFKFKG